MNHMIQPKYRLIVNMKSEDGTRMKLPTLEQLKHTLESKKRASSVQALSGTNLSKTDLRYWKKRVFQPKYTRDGNTHKSPNWAVYIQHRGRRHKWSLGTANQEAAAAKAKDIFMRLQSGGWEAAVQKYKPSWLRRSAPSQSVSSLMR
jgi:hypothetical protein